jgi:NitT/TauT family transport system permease protein
MQPMRKVPLFTIRASVPDNIRGILTFGSIAGFLALWSILTVFHVVSAAFLPSPLAILNAIITLTLDHGLLKAIGVSTLRILLATFFSIAVAFPLGVLMGTFDAINRFLEPVLNPLRYMPITAFIPLLILWFGIDESQKISFLFLGTFVFLYPVVIDAIRAVPEDLVNTARTLGANRLQVVFTVLIPSALPQIADSFRNLNAIAWGYVILAEIVNARAGIGALLNVASQHARTEWTLAGIVVIGIIGYVSDQIILRLTQVAFRWRENNG